MAFLPIFVSCAVLSALSISNLGLISSMVGFLLDQKHHVHTYQVNWPGNTVQLAVLPEHLWTDQGHESNGVAGYGFFLGLFGLFVAWHQRKRNNTSPSKLLLTLVILLFLAVLFTLSAIIFVNLVSNQTKGQHILESVARSNVHYPLHWWTPETWYKAVRELPLADQHVRNTINSKLTNMMAWRWLLIPIFIADIVAFGIATKEYLAQRKDREHNAEQKVQLMPFKNPYMNAQPSPGLHADNHPYRDDPKTSRR